MNAMGSYKFGFDYRVLILFAVIMIPNIIWFIIPAPNDVLRIESVIPTIDMIASISQVTMLIILIFVLNRNFKEFEFKNPLVLLCTIVTALYLLSWVLYYLGISTNVVILVMMILPCLAFIFYGIYVQNYISLIPSSIFLVSHFIFGLVNFVL